MPCCFRVQHLEWLRLHICFSIRRVLVEGCGKVFQATPSGGTPTSSSFGHPARVLLHGPMSCTHLDTQCAAVPETGNSSGREGTGLGRQDPCVNSFLPFPCVCLQIFLSDIGGQNSRLCPCSISACRTPLSLHIHTSRPWPHLPTGQNKAPCMPLPGELWASASPRDRCAGTGVRRGRLLVLRPFFRVSNSKTWSLQPSRYIASEPTPRPGHTRAPQQHPFVALDR